MRIVYIGTGEIGVPSLRALADAHSVVGVVTQPDKPAGRKMELRPPPVKLEALARRIRVFQPVRIREAAAVESIRLLKPEAIVIMAYGQILPGELLGIPLLACLNLHASLLPKFRGASPVHAAILAGESETGISVMHVTGQLDAGDIVFMKRIPILRRERVDTLHDRLAAAGPEAILEALGQLQTGTAPRIPQDGSQASFCQKLSAVSGGIDWTRGRRQVDLHIRGMSSWPGAFTHGPAMKNGLPKKWKIGSAYPVRRLGGAPGVIVRADARGIVVGTGDGGVLIRTLQPEGSRWMTVAEFLAGHSIQEGDCLTSPCDQRRG